MADSVDSPKEKMGENKIPLQKKKKKKPSGGRFWTLERRPTYTVHIHILIPSI